MLKVIFRMSWFSTEVNTVTAGKDVGPYWLGLSKFVSQERARRTRCTSCRDGFYLIALWWVVFFNVFNTQLNRILCMHMHWLQCVSGSSLIITKIRRGKTLPSVMFVTDLFFVSLYFFNLSLICDRRVCGFFLRVCEVWCNLKSVSFCKFVYCK